MFFSVITIITDDIVVTESEGVATVCLMLSGQASTDVEVPITIENASS